MSTTFFAIFHLFSGQGFPNFSVLIIQVTVAKSLKIWIRDLVPEFLAHTLGILGPLQAAGAIASGPLQALLHGGHNFLVGIQMNCHFASLPSLFRFHDHLAVFRTGGKDADGRFKGINDRIRHVRKKSKE